MTITDEMVAKAKDALRGCHASNTSEAQSVIKAVFPLIRSAALEEAARVAEKHDPAFSASSSILDDVASAIRALKDNDPRTPTEGERQ